MQMQTCRSGQFVMKHTAVTLGFITAVLLLSVRVGSLPLSLPSELHLSYLGYIVPGFPQSATAAASVPGLLRDSLEMIAAVKLAVEWLNNRTDVLPHNTIRYSLHDSGTSSTRSQQAAINICVDQVTNKHYLADAVVGMNFANEAIHAALTFGLYGVPTVSGFSIADTLLDKSTYPTYFPTTASTADEMEFLSRVCGRLGWSRVAILTDQRNQENGVAFGKALLDVDPSADTPQVAIPLCPCESTRSSVGCQLGSTATQLCRRETVAALQRLRDLGYTVFFLSVFLDHLGVLMEALSEADMLRPQYSFLLDRFAATNTAFINDPRSSGMLGSTVISANFSRYSSIWASKLAVDPAFLFNIQSPRISSTRFDEVFFIATVWDKMTQLERTTCNVTSATDTTLVPIPMVTVNQALSRKFYCANFSSLSGRRWMASALGYSTSLHGISGEVVFNSSTLQFSGGIALANFRNGSVALVGEYQNGQMTVDFSAIRFADGSNIAPLDALPPVNTRVFLSDGATIGLVFLVTFVCFYAILMMVFNVYYRHNPHIQLSSPRINLLALVGCLILEASGLIVLLVEILRPEPAEMDAYCRSSRWLASYGASITLGALVGKIARVWHIFNHKRKLTDRHIIYDHHIVAFIVVLLVLDTMTGLLIQSTLKNQTDTAITSSVRREIGGVTDTEFYVSCSSDGSAYTVIRFTYKLVILVAGVAFAWMNRSLKISALNDSTWVGYSLYNTLLVAMMIVPVLLLSSDPFIEMVCAVVGISAILIGIISFLFLPRVVTVLFPREKDKLHNMVVKLDQQDHRIEQLQHENAELRKQNSSNREESVSAPPSPSFDPTIRPYQSESAKRQGLIRDPVELIYRVASISRNDAVPRAPRMPPHRDSQSTGPERLNVSVEYQSPPATPPASKEIELPTHKHIPESKSEEDCIPGQIQMDTPQIEEEIE